MAGPDIPAGSPAAALVRPPRLSRRDLLLLFAGALVVRIAHVLAMADSPYFDHPVVDAGTFTSLGWSMASGHGYPEAVFWHPPGYPCFLGAIWWIVGDSFLAPRLVQALLGALSVVLVAWLGGHYFGRGVGLASGLVAALYAMLIYFDGELLAPTPALFTVLAAVSVAARAAPRGRRVLWLTAGGLGGLAATLVATSLVVPAVLATCARRRAPWVILGAGLTLAPVTARNYLRGHELVLISSNGGINFWLGNNPDYEATVHLRPDLAWRRLVDEPARAGVLGHGASSRYFVRKALAWATAEPAAFLRLQLHKLRRLVGGDEIFRNQAIYPARAHSTVLALLLWKIPGLAFPFGVLAPLALLGLVVAGRRAAPLAAVAGGLAVVVLAFFITARYRVVLVPFLIVFAAEGGRWLLREADRRRRLVAAAALLPLFLAANLGQGTMDDGMNADAEYSLGVRLGSEGRMAEAQAWFESVVATEPGYLEAWLNLSVCYDAAGRPAQARRAFSRAFALDRDGVLALVRRFLREGRPEVAQALAGHLRAALAADDAGERPSPQP